MVLVYYLICNVIIYKKKKEKSVDQNVKVIFIEDVVTHLLTELTKAQSGNL
jgi:hypothetical protein